MKCTLCGKELKEKNAVFLDLNMRNNMWRLEPWPENESQGAFPFGKDCAKRLTKR